MAKIHRNLSRQHDFAVSALGKQALDRNRVIFGNRALDDLRRDLFFLHVRQQIAQGFDGEFQRQRTTAQLRIGDHAGEGSFEFTDVADHMLRDELYDLIVHVEVVETSAVAQNRDSRFNIRRLDIRNQTPLKTGAQALFQTADFLRRTVGADDDLFVCVMQRVEGVEKLLLHGLFLCDELHVVDEQHVYIAVALSKLQPLIQLNRRDELVGEGFAGDVHDPRGGIVSLDRMSDGVHEVGFAQTHAAVQEQRVVCRGGVLRNRERRRVRKVVGAADHEGFKRILRVERKDVDGFRADGVDIDIPVFRQDDLDVADGLVCGLDRVPEILKIEVFERFLNVRRGHFQNENILLEREGYDHVDPGVKGQSRHLRTDIFPCGRPNRLQLIHSAIPPILKYIIAKME